MTHLPYIHMLHIQIVLSNVHMPHPIYKFTTSVRLSVTEVLGGGGKGGPVEATGDLSATGNCFHFHLHWNGSKKTKPFWSNTTRLTRFSSMGSCTRRNSSSSSNDSEHQTYHQRSSLYWQQWGFRPSPAP